MSENIKTLAMLKMEKNFVALVEKGYPRKPYEEYTLDELNTRLMDEVEELDQYIVLLRNKLGTLAPEYQQIYTNMAKAECADISNIVDYIRRLHFRETGEGEPMTEPKIEKKNPFLCYKKRSRKPLLPISECIVEGCAECNHLEVRCRGRLK